MCVTFVSLFKFDFVVVAFFVLFLFFCFSFFFLTIVLGKCYIQYQDQTN